MLGPDSLSSSGNYQEFATLALLESGFTGVTRWVICAADGVLISKQAEGGTSRTMTMKANVRYDINAVGFTASGSSGCVPVQVFR